ncbi:hypothetical protein COO60DRAFT_381011 [Scenedesmus sp. NREL 46B-D3]|nr:hypothetical protein COO60DRAFT_381011 [Scenedesmus sp. NREL 46B-D3]
MIGFLLQFAAIILLVRTPEALTFDTFAHAHNRTVLDTQLEGLIETSVEWLEVRAVQLDYPALSQYANQLQRVLRPSCKQCTDYFEAVSVVRSLGKAVKQILTDDKDEVLYPALRRSYLAAVWILQRSRLFAWQATQLNSNVLSTLFRMYLHHTNRAKGRTVSFHHISKCGGTTMCQLAASNRCSNPSMDQERNCVLDSRLDGPLWMVAHDITQQGAFPNTTVGKLDATAAPIPWVNMTAAQRELAKNFSVEPPLPMWLMYACPYTPIGRPNTCHSRTQQARVTRSTFLANERTLSKSSGAAQVCHQFTNVIILRQPVPHVVSLLAEAKFRYVRQLAIWHNVTSWQPPAWDISWWERLGPALVGNYATRTLVGRESFCRSAGNMSSADLTQGVKALLGFDMVMTLDRAKDIDLLVSAMLGWPARKFSSQPASRVREVAPRQIWGGFGAAGGSSSSSSSALDWRPVGSDEDLRQYSSALQHPPHLAAEGAGGAAAGLQAGNSSSSSSSSSGSSSSSSASNVVSRNINSSSSSRSGYSNAGGGNSSGAHLSTGSSLTGDRSSASTSSSKSSSSSSSSTVQATAKETSPVLGTVKPSRMLLMHRKTHQRPSAGAAAAAAVAAAQLSHAGGAVTGLLGKLQQPRLLLPFVLQQQQRQDMPAAESAAVDEGDYSDDDDDSKGLSDEEFALAASKMYAPRSAAPAPLPPAPPAVPKEVVEADAAVALVARVWLERRVQLAGFQSIAAAGKQLPQRPAVAYMQQRDQHGAHLVRVTLPQGSSESRSSPQQEVWHAFPRHAFAFTAADLARLERLTSLDAQLVQTADLLLDLDTAWLQSLLHSHHYRKRMKGVAATFTACGFSGMMPLTDAVQEHVLQPEALLQKSSSSWIS